MNAILSWSSNLQQTFNNLQLSVGFSFEKWSLPPAVLRKSIRPSASVEGLRWLDMLFFHIGTTLNHYSRICALYMVWISIFMFVLILMTDTVLQYFALLFWILLQNMIGFLRQCIGGLRTSRCLSVSSSPWISSQDFRHSTMSSTNIRSKSVDHQVGCIKHL